MKWRRFRNIRIETRHPDDLIPLNNSPIHTNDRRRRGMRNKLRRYGQVNCIWIDRHICIRDGHEEWRILKRQGVENVCVIVAY